MDSDPWISRLTAAKMHYLQHKQQSSHSDRFDGDEFELEEEARHDFTCPFCNEGFDMASLCSHLEDEHSFESKAAVCPICSFKVAGDMLNHIMSQHGDSSRFQRYRRLRRAAIPSGQAVSLLRRDLREAHLQVLLGSGAYRSSNSSTSIAAADSFLSSIGLNFPPSEAEESSKSLLFHVDDFIRKKSTTTRTWNSSSIDLSLSQEEREKKQRQATIIANFVQDLLLSTLFGD